MPETLPEGRERDRRELALRNAIGGPLIAIRGYAAPEVGEAYCRARVLCERLGETAPLFAALSGEFVYHFVRGDHPHDAGADRGDPAAVGAVGRLRPSSLAAHRLSAITAMQAGAFPEARAEFEQILRLYDPDRHRPPPVHYVHDPKISALTYLALILWLLGFPEQARRSSAAAFRYAEELNQVNLTAHVRVLCRRRAARAAARRGRGPHARRRDRRSLAAARLALLAPERPDPPRVGAGPGRGGRGGRRADAAQRHRARRARRRLVSGPLPLHAGRDPSPAPPSRKRDSGSSPRPRSWWRGTRTGCGRRNSPGSRASCCGRVARWRPPRPASSVPWRRPAGRGPGPWSCAPRPASPGSWADRGKRPEARDLLGSVYGWFTEGFDTPDLNEARALFDELDAVTGLRRR